MSVLIMPGERKTVKSEITKITCPECGEKLRGVGLEKDSRVDGLVFRCKRCGAYWAVKTQ